VCCCCLLYLSFPSVCILTSITTFRSIACFGNRLVRLAPESKNPATPTSSQSFSYYIVAIVDLFVCFVLFTLALKSTWVYTWRSRYTQSQHTVHYKRLGSWLRGWMCSYWLRKLWWNNIREKLPMIHSRSWCLHDSPLLLLILAVYRVYSTYCVNNTYSNEWRYPRNASYNNSVRIRTEFRTKKATAKQRQKMVNDDRWSSGRAFQEVIAERWKNLIKML
jgi:hypothetical protein